MGLSAALLRWAAAAPVPVFVVAGVDARTQAQQLQLDPRIRLVEAPRRAGLLLVVGHLTEPLLAASVATHDAMPHPRGCVEWRLDPAAGTAPMIPGSLVSFAGDPVAQLIDMSTQLITAGRPSSRPIRADADPAPWRGVGPYGQGGSGMTGGVPYGRPMAERDDDRDGLTLDALPVQIGPLFTGFPDGLTARVTFKGDLVHRFELRPNPFEGPPPKPATSLFVRALREPVAVHHLELARASALMRWAAHELRVHGLAALSVRVLALASTAQPEDVAVLRRLHRRLAVAMVSGRRLKGIGRIADEHLEDAAAGPVSRAAGIEEDVRSDDPVYRDLGFRPITGRGGDAAERFRQRLREAEQALELAGRAEDQRVGGRGIIESPCGRLTEDSSPTSRLLEHVPGLVTGLEWGDAVATLLSLDLDLREAAAVASTPATPAS